MTNHRSSESIELVVRGGTLVDGTGAPAFQGDLAIAQGRIVAVGGRIDAPGAETIDADGALVAPGWVDVHTHFDGQVAWDDALDPSFSNGVTTFVMGNCGVGFAPCPKGEEKALIEVMEGVEDIPGTALAEGVPWGAWESFGEYLDYIDGRPYSMDFGTQLPHSALRLQVMRDRAVRHEEATPEDVAEMTRLAEAAARAGALGFSTSRTIFHRSIGGEAIPGTYASAEELKAIACGLAAGGGVVLEAISSSSIGDMKFLGGERFTAEQEMALLADLSRASGLPVTFTTVQTPDHPEDWRDVLRFATEQNARGATLRPQVASRPIGLLTGLSGYHGFMHRKTYLEELAALPLAERAARMRDPEMKRRVLADADVVPDQAGSMAALSQSFLLAAAGLYMMPDDYDYEPGPELTLGARAAREGRPIEEVYYDYLTEREGRLFASLMGTNYPDGNLDAVREMIAHPETVTGLADAGAHVHLICDGTMPTTQLAFWCGGRKRGEGLPLEQVIEKQTRRNARLYGLHDRGTLEVGMRADLNVIDRDRLAVRRPESFRDLPAGGARLLQPVSGYVATLMNGVVTRRDDRDTGARPGRLIRGPRPGPTLHG
ncbi:MAG: N-acyl-D-amino-acid deacylase family protein [bacterium]